MRRPWIALLLIVALLVGQTGRSAPANGIWPAIGGLHAVVSGPAGSNHDQRPEQDSRPLHCCGHVSCSQPFILEAPLPLGPVAFSAVRRSIAQQVSGSTLLAEDPPVPKLSA